MRPLTAPIILTFIPIATSLLLLLSSFTSVKANDLENCCDKVYLFSSDLDAIAGTHPLFLGIYKYGGQHKNRPYFYKKEQYMDYTQQQIVESKFFLVFAENVTIGEPGWRVAMDLDANQTYITTNSVNFSNCPIGVTEGVALSDWNGQLQMNKDTTFLIECHKDEVLDHCDNCKLLIANATGIVKNFYPLYLGEYKQNGSFNGHPLYAMRQMAQIYDINLEKMIWKNLTTYLYFRKKGTIDDGWAIDEQLGKNTQAIITQVSSPCPEKVNRGFVLKQDMNYDSDFSVNITCVQKELGKKSVKSPLENNEIDKEKGQAQALPTKPTSTYDDSASHAKSTFSNYGISTQTVFLLHIFAIIGTLLKFQAI